MILTIHQPSYFPWLGLLDKIAKSDTFVLLDDVQVVKGTYQYRNIFNCNGEAKYLTLPINYYFGVTFNQLKFRNDAWIKDHLNKLHHYYFKAPYFAEVYEELINVFNSFRSKDPIDVLENSMSYCLDIFDVESTIIRSSAINYNGKKGEMVLDICKKTAASEYISGQGSFEYMQELLPVFKRTGINIQWQSFTHPKYEQHHKYDFVNGLSALDLLFFCGYENAKEIFWTNLKHNE